MWDFYYSTLLSSPFPPSALRLRSGYYSARGTVSFSHPPIFNLVFRPKRSFYFFENATADGWSFGIPLPRVPLRSTRGY